jgi:hypothetical protein
MDFDITSVRLRTANRDFLTLAAGEALPDVVVPVYIGPTGQFLRAAANDPDTTAVTGLSVLEVDTIGDEVPTIADALLEVTLGSGQTMYQGTTLVLSPNAGKICRLQDLQDGDELVYLGWAKEDNVLQVKINRTGITMTNPSPPLSVTLSGNIDNADWGSSEIILVNGGAADRDITGMVARPAGFQRWIVNVGATNNLVIKHDVTSTAANRFRNVPGADITLAPDEMAAGFYDAVVSRWRMA